MRTRRVIEANLPGLLGRIAPGDLVVLHDPQTAGLVRPLQQHGCTVAWRSHIGAEQPNDYVHEAWSFIEPYVREADTLIFSRFIYIPEVLANGPTAIVAPSIDPFAPKNQELDADAVNGILVAAGLLRGDATRRSTGLPPVYRRSGSRAQPGSAARWRSSAGRLTDRLCCRCLAGTTSRTISA